MILLSFCLLTPRAHARMALVVGEPFGSFGTMMPQGHASVYLSDLCVDTPVRLRPCRAGELGAVVSRYHDLRHPDIDWMAFPLPVFLYGTAALPAEPPPYRTARQEAALREAYWHDNLTEYVPARKGKRGGLLPPAYGDWEEGIGAAYDRRLILYAFDTTPSIDATVLAWLNDRPNRRSYTLTRHNCADFSADLLRIALPPATLHRNVLADFDMTTPKQLAREVDGYGREHPELHPAVYEVPQLPGAMRRSRPIRGAAESLLSQKRYMATLLVLQPEIILAAWIDYERLGKWPLGADAVAVQPGFWDQPEARGIAMAEDLAAPEKTLPVDESSPDTTPVDRSRPASYSSGAAAGVVPSPGLRAK